MPTGYTRFQIILHWLMFVLIGAMFLNEDAIGEAFRSVMRTGTFEQNLLVAAHIFGGIAILALVAVRFVIKLRRGAPPLPEHEPPLFKLAATLTHLGLYALMFLVPIAGLVAWFGQQAWAGEIHEVLQNLLLILAILHVAGALYQQFILKSDILSRMRTPQ